MNTPKTMMKKIWDDFRFFFSFFLHFFVSKWVARLRFVHYEFTIFLLTDFSNYESTRNLHKTSPRVVRETRNWQLRWVKNFSLWFSHPQPPKELSITYTNNYFVERRGKRTKKGRKSHFHSQVEKTRRRSLIHFPLVLVKKMLMNCAQNSSNPVLMRETSKKRLFFVRWPSLEFFIVFSFSSIRFWFSLHDRINIWTFSSCNKSI